MAKRLEVLSRHILPQETAAHETDPNGYAVIDRKKLTMLLEKEEQLFLEKHPKRYEVWVYQRNACTWSLFGPRLGTCPLTLFRRIPASIICSSP